MRIILKDLNDDALKLLKDIKKQKGKCPREPECCERCPIKFLDCGYFDEQKIKVNKKKRKAALIRA